MKASKLSLCGFRGATTPVDLTFDPTKPVTLIFGENATGKSTIADALDFICNGRLGSLDDRSLASQRKKYVVSVGHNPAHLSVTLRVAGGDEFKATLAKDGPATTPAGCPDARILRRSNILQLLDATPKDRFEVIRSFVSVPGIEKSEGALRDQLRTISKEYDESVRAYTQASAALDSLWNEEGAPGPDALAWAAAESGKDVGQLKTSVNASSGLVAVIDNATAALSRLDALRSELSSSEEELETLQVAQEAAEARAAAGGASLLALLKDAASYVESVDLLESCPVCEQTVETQKLRGRLHDRIADMKELSAVVSATAAAHGTKQNKEAVVVQARQEFHAAAKALAISLHESTLSEVAALGIQWSDFSELVGEDVILSDDGSRTMCGHGLSIRPALEDRARVAQKSIDQRNAIKGYHDTYHQHRETATALSVITNKMDAVLEIISKERKAYVQGILDKVSSEVDRLYTALHPAEGLGGVRFYLKPNVIGSLEFDGHFLTTTDIPPQAYYSDSHLDTLGICVFLALAELFMDDNTIVVLDDVVTSVDGPHLERIMELLHAEAPKLNQVIVSTHYRPWRDLYRYARGPAGNIQLIELRRWTIGGGVQPDETENVIEELRSALANSKFDRQSVASKAGIQLENILDFVTYKYRARLPRQADPNYTLSDLAGGIDSKLGKLLKVSRPDPAGTGTIDTLLKPLIEAAVSYMWVRNRAGAHFHSLASDIPDGQIKDFGTTVLDLAEVIVCQKCECFPAKDKSGSYWQCECGDVKLYPHAAPS